MWNVMMIRVINQQQPRSSWWSRPSWVVGPWNKGHVPLTSRPLSPPSPYTCVVPLISGSFIIQLDAASCDLTLILSVYKDVREVVRTFMTHNTAVCGLSGCHGCQKTLTLATLRYFCCFYWLWAPYYYFVFILSLFLFCFFHHWGKGVVCFFLWPITSRSEESSPSLVSTLSCSY